MIARLSMLVIPALLTGCYVSNPVSDPDSVPAKVRRDQSFGKLFGDTLTFGGAKKDSAPAIGVNAFLWRASLEALGFLPLASADPFGGVIITDWHMNPHNRNERLKIDVIIADRRLRSDALKVRVFKQVWQQSCWVGVPLDPHVSQNLENVILKRARELRLKAKS